MKFSEAVTKLEVLNRYGKKMSSPTFLAFCCNALFLFSLLPILQILVLSNKS